MLWVDPNPLVIVSTRSSFDRGKAAPAVGAVEPAELLSRLCQQVDPVWPARRNRQPNPSPLVCFEQTTALLPPGIAAVCGLEQSASRGFDRLATANFPRGDARRPERGIHRLWIAGFKRQVHCAGILVAVQDPLPGLTAVDASKNSAL